MLLGKEHCTKCKYLSINFEYCWNTKIVTKGKGFDCITLLTVARCRLQSGKEFRLDKTREELL